MNRKLALFSTTWKTPYTAMNTKDRISSQVKWIGFRNSWRKAFTRNKGPNTSNQMATP